MTTLTNLQIIFLSLLYVISIGIVCNIDYFMDIKSFFKPTIAWFGITYFLMFSVLLVILFYVYLGKF